MNYNWITQRYGKGRSKALKALHISHLLMSFIMIATGVFPFVYVFIIYDAPEGPSEQRTYTETLLAVCIIVALITTAMEGASGVVQSIVDLTQIRKETLCSTQ